MLVGWGGGGIGVGRMGGGEKLVLVGWGGGREVSVGRMGGGEGGEVGASRMGGGG